MERIGKVAVLSCLLLLLGAKQSDLGSRAFFIPSGAACVAPTMTYRWTPTNSGYGAMTDQVAGDNATQSTGGDQPTYSGSVAALGGKPGVVFNGSSDFLSISTPVPDSSAYFSMYAVFVAGGINQVLLGDVPGSGGQTAIYMINRLTQTMELNVYNGGGLSAGTTINSGIAYTVGVQYNSSTLALAYFMCSGGTCSSDGTYTLGGATINLPINAIGNDGSGSYLNATIGEVAYVNGPLPTTALGTYSLCQFSH